MTYLKTSTTVGTPVALSDALKTCRQFTLIACKTLAGPTASPNAGTVKIGQSSAVNEQPIELEPGGERVFEYDGGVYDLNKWFMDVGTSGDGVVVIFH